MQAVIQTPDEREPLGKAFWGSVAAHAAVVGIVFALGYFHITDNWGSQHASSGSVGVTMIKSIPIPRREAPENPLANQTESIVPQKVERVVKAKPEVKAPEPKAIPIPDRVEKPRKLSPKPLAPEVFKPQVYQANQVYSKTPQAMSSKMYGMQGAGGIDMGAASVLGDRFGAYTDLLKQLISQHWNQSGLNAAASQRCSISFVIARNGSLSNIQVAQPSGNYSLDNSAKRAVIDSNPLPSLPPQYLGSEVPVTLWFQLKQ